MATPQLSPGVLTREIDQTVGRADNVLANIGAIAGPFPIGPVDFPVDIATEQDLINVFGKPSQIDNQYEYWMSASTYLSYGGVLKVVRTSGTSLNNSNAGVGIASSNAVKIKNYDDYLNNWTTADNFTFAAKNPGTWADSLKVCVIDDLADQTLSGINTSTITSTTTSWNNVVSTAGTVGAASTTYIVGINTNLIVVGQTLKLKSGFVGVGVTVIGISTDNTYSGGAAGGIIEVNPALINDDAYSPVNFSFGSYTTTTTIITNSIQVGYGVTQSLAGVTNPGIGTTSTLNGYLKGIVTGVGNSSLDVKITSYVSASGDETSVDYQQGGIFAFSNTGNVAIHSEGQLTSYGSASYTSQDDWYDNQTLELTNSTVYWKSIAPKPVSTRYTLDRNGKNDGINIVIVDDLGKVSGVQGAILEKHVGLSKAIDCVSAVNSPQKIWYKQYLADFSTKIYAGINLSSSSDSYWGTVPTATGFSTGFTATDTNNWGDEAQSTVFASIGNVTYSLSGGSDYSGSGGLAAELGYLVTSYNLFSNADSIAADYLIMGPGLSTREESQAKANALISIATQRKDAIATISPHRDDVVNITDSTDQTNRIISFFTPLSSSSYAVFDTGYKYTYDRFNNKFVYIPCNADVAGLMCRTNIISYPWYSPAGQQRGILNNAIKLAYNPSKAQRDQLYPLRINSIITQPGIGTLLYGDKTALNYASSFDRINVRRLFLTIEKALQQAANAQLFEINDEFTRANFRNIVEPYLRDIQSKNGLYGYLVVCDTTNNTPDIIDNNEFRADIYLKPAKSINYITLTFVATRTGVSFAEVAGTAG